MEKFQKKKRVVNASFHKRSWPTAEYEDGSMAAMIQCEDNYHYQKAKTGNHAALTVYVADHSLDPVWKWRKLILTFETLKEAKEAVLEILKKYPNFQKVRKEDK